jgi:hypothetical protein
LYKIAFKKKIEKSKKENLMITDVTAGHSTFELQQLIAEQIAKDDQTQEERANSLPLEGIESSEDVPKPLHNLMENFVGNNPL